MYYKLDENKNVVPCSLEEWAKQRKEMERTHTKHVAEDIIDGKRISTVWLGIDHNVYEKSPHVFETMIFNNIDSYVESYCNRYSTYKEALEGHKEAIEWVKNK